MLDVIGSGGNFSQWRSLILAIDLAKGLDHLHNRKTPIIHGDLRPSNLLLGGSRNFNKYHKDLTADEIGVLKVTDFGLIRTLQKHNLIMDNDGVPLLHTINENLESPFNSTSQLDAPQLSGLMSMPMKSMPIKTLPRAESHSLKMFLSGNMSFRGSMRRSLRRSEAQRGRERHPTQDSFEAFPVALPARVTASGAAAEDGTLRYIPPEVYRREVLTFASDVYSYGMILYHLFEISPPFSDLNPEEAAKAASQGLRPWGKTNLVGQTVPQKIKDIVERCWQHDYSKRIDLPTIIASLQDIATHMKPSVTSRNPEDEDEEEACCSCIG